MNTMHRISALLLLSACALPAPRALAEPVEVANPGFEERPVEPSEEGGGYYITGPNGEVPGNLIGWNYPRWAHVRVALNTKQGEDGETVVEGAEGRQHLLLFPWVESQPATEHAPAQVDGSQIWQVLPESVQPGTYELTVAAGYAGSLWHCKADARLALETTDGDPANPTFTKLGEVVVNLEERWRNKEQPKDMLEDFFLAVEVPANSPRIGEQLVIRLSSNRNGDTDDNVAFDHVRLEFKTAR